MMLDVKEESSDDKKIEKDGEDEKEVKLYVGNFFD